MPTSHAWTAQWIDLDAIGGMGHNMSPPRSGHVSFSLEDKVYVFGGYAEEDSVTEEGSTTATRYPTNDLWCFEPKAHSNEKDEDSIPNHGWTLEIGRAHV